MIATDATAKAAPDGYTLLLTTPNHNAVRTPELAERLKRDGVEPVGGTPEAFGALIAKEIVQWRNLAQSAKITLD